MKKSSDNHPILCDNHPIFHDNRQAHNIKKCLHMLNIRHIVS